MQKNKIEGVKPFNEMFYKSCFYHQLFAGLACLGIELDNILLNSFVVIQSDFQIQEKTFLKEKILAKKMGYKYVKCDIDKNRLISAIDKGYPLIVGVDSYYLESRRDTYMTIHEGHFVLVYGYNLETDEAYIVDHNYRTSYEYIEKQISLKNLLFAHEKFRGGKLQRKYTSGVLHACKHKKNVDISLFLKKQEILQNKECSLENVNTLMRLIDSDLQTLAEIGSKLLNYFKSLRFWLLAISKTKLFCLNVDMRCKLDDLINTYSNFVALFFKMELQKNYDYAYKKKDFILRKLANIKNLERDIYNYWGENWR